MKTSLCTAAVIRFIHCGHPITHPATKAILRFIHRGRCLVGD
ncbi:MAG TPA: hypothetical protein PKK93_07630 [Bacteroidales bacterium]|nr:hypothetical protein [Bacteroidales bacterium]HQL46533.1 hypothetical protein [Bacteroidales bacterium]